MTQVHVKPAQARAVAPPAPNGDFYRIMDVLDGGERATVLRVRAFMESEVAPIIEDYWAKAKFPFEIVAKLPGLDIGGVGYEGYGCAGGRWLLNGFICMELA